MSPTARVGAFMLLALLILGVFIVKIEELPIGARSGRTQVKAVFPSVAGLDAKSAVRIAGVRVGIVERIELQGDQALVTLGLDRGVVLYDGAWAEVANLGMLGDKYVELFPGSPHQPPLPAGRILSGVSPVAFDQVLRTVTDVGEDIRAVTTNLRQSLGGELGQQRLDEIVENIRQITAEIRELVAANRGEIDATVTNLRSFSQTLSTELPKLAERLNGLAERVDSLVAENREDITASIGNIRELSARLQITADNLNQITTRLAAGEGSIGKLLNDDETVDNLNSTLRAAESGVESLKNTIGRVERFTLDLNLRSETLPDLDESRSSFGIDLHTTDRRFFRLEMVDSPYGRERTYTETITTILPDGRRETSVVESTKLTQGNTINAQVGYHINDLLTVRAGIFESRGGVGLDAHLAKNRVHMSFEASDFGRDIKPPFLRLEGRYFINRNIFAFAGWNDPRWSDRSSVLLGGGVTWRDDDLKYLLGGLSSLAGR